MNSKILLLGSSGPISTGLLNYYGDSAIVLGRTNAKHGYFDLEDHKTFGFLNEVDADCAIFLSSLSGFKLCETNPNRAFRMNVYASSEAIAILNRRNIPVVFVSSSAVFGPKDYVRCEHSIANPETVYGVTKHLLERDLLSGQFPKNTIVRLTKVCHSTLPIIQRWKAAVVRGEKIAAYKGMRLSPLPLSIVVDTLVKVVTEGIKGVVHITPDKDLSYIDLANALFPGTEVMAVNQEFPVALSEGQTTLSVSRTDSVVLALAKCIDSIISEVTTETGV